MDVKMETDIVYTTMKELNCEFTNIYSAVHDSNNYETQEHYMIMWKH